MIKSGTADSSQPLPLENEGVNHIFFSDNDHYIGVVQEKEVVVFQAKCAQFILRRALPKGDEPISLLELQDVHLGRESTLKSVMLGGEEAA